MPSVKATKRAIKMKCRSQRSSLRVLKNLVRSMIAVGETGIIGFYLKNRITKIPMVVVMSAWIRCMRKRRDLYLGY